MDTYEVRVYVKEKDEPFIYTPEKHSGFGYRVNDTVTPDCLRFWYDRKTVIVPLQNLVVAELDL